VILKVDEDLVSTLEELVIKVAAALVKVVELAEIGFRAIVDAELPSLEGEPYPVFIPHSCTLVYPEAK